MTRTRVLASLAGLALLGLTGATAVVVGDAITVPSSSTATPTGSPRTLDLDLPVDDDPDRLADQADQAAQDRADATAEQLAPAPATRSTAAAPRPPSRQATTRPSSSSSSSSPAPVVEDQADDVAVEDHGAEPDANDPRCATLPADVCGDTGDQLPEEVIGGARCPDPTHVIVAIVDGAAVCGPADDTADVLPAA